MANLITRALSHLELEERILNAGALIALIGVFLPWFSGEWLGGERMIAGGLGFYTTFLGWGVLLINCFLVLVTLVPLVGGPVILKRRIKAPIRFFLTAQSAVLVLAALSVLTKVTFEFSRMEVRFGIYLTLVGTLVSALYAFLIFQEQRNGEPQEVFQHPEHRQPSVERRETVVTKTNIPPPPPPPPPSRPEEHRLRPQ